MDKARDISSILDGADLVGFKRPPQEPSPEREALREVPKVGNKGGKVLTAKVGDKTGKTFSAKVGPKIAALSAKVGFKDHRALSSKAGIKIVRID
jgi:hypothetical protein